MSAKWWMGPNHLCCLVVIKTMANHTCDQQISSISRWQAPAMVSQKLTYLRGALLGKARKPAFRDCTTLLFSPSPPTVSAQLSAVMCYILGDRHITHCGLNIRTLAPTQHHPRNAWYKLLSWFTSFIFLIWLQAINIDQFRLKGTSEDHLVQHGTQNMVKPQPLQGPGWRLPSKSRKKQ